MYSMNFCRFQLVIDIIFLLFLSIKEWKDLFILAEKHSLIGICFNAIEKLSEIQRLEPMLLMCWYGLAQMICKKKVYF